VAVDDGGTLWVGTARGLTRWRDGQERTYAMAEGLPGTQVLAVLPGRDGALWVGTDVGLARWREGRFDVPVPVSAAVSALDLDEGGVLWVGTDRGVARVEVTATGAGRLQWLGTEPELRMAAIGEVRGMAGDGRGTRWVSAGGRLLRVDGDRLVRARATGGPQVGKVRSLFRDDEGVVWLGTRDGLVRLQGGQWRTFGAAEGLGRADLYQIVADDLGFLWVGTGAGILRIARSSLAAVERGTRDQLEVLRFDVSDQGREVGATRTHQPSAWKGRDGRLWFATQRGVVSVDPARVRLNTLPPPVRIEEAIVDGRRAGRGTVTTFPPGSGAMEFHFAAITLLEPQKARHRYLLEGLDRDWIDAGTRRVAYYTNVRPGRYRFRVQGSNGDGVWNEAGAAVALVLAPHFHQTWWFYGLVLLGLSGLLLAFHRMRVAQLHSRYSATVAERTRVARDLHDSLLQGMAAELMRLRGLRKLFSGAIPRPTDAAIAGEIAEIEEVVAGNIEEGRRFLWDLREGQHRRVDLASALPQLARKLAANTGVEVRVVVEGTAAPVPQHLGRELLLVMQEAVTNALKHGEPREVEVRLRCEGPELSLRITDDGRGFDPAAVAGAEAGHFGLQGMRERAAALGTFQLDSRPGGPTRVEVVVQRQELHDD
jgi:signal transduction histidine kinase